jgi:hypothetical protein
LGNVVDREGHNRSRIHPPNALSRFDDLEHVAIGQRELGIMGELNVRNRDALGRDG